MNNVLFKDVATTHRIRINNKKRVVYARYDHESNFVRYVVHKTDTEIKKAQKQYLPAKVGVTSWFEVFTHNFV